MITNAQAETIATLISFHYEPGMQIIPEEVFPARDNVDGARRRSISKLAQLGLLEQPDRWRNIFMMKQAAIDAYREWYRKKGFNVSGHNYALNS